MSVEIKGKVVQIMKKQSGVSKNGNTWEVQPFVLETLDEKYPRKIYIEIFGEERINQCPLDMGYDITVHCDIESLEYNGHWYTKVRAWKIDSNAPTLEERLQGQEEAPAAAMQEENSDDLPF